MRKALWRIACMLAAACGIAFGLWAGAGIARAAAEPGVGDPAVCGIHSAPRRPAGPAA